MVQYLFHEKIKPNAKYENIKERYFLRYENSIKSELFWIKLVKLPKK